MRPVQQTLFYTESKNRGDCLRACVASLLELRIDDVPNFVETEDYQISMDTFLGKYGFQSLSISIRDLDDFRQENAWCPSGYHMIDGISSRGVRHAVVGYQGKIVFDPHPDNDGLIRIEGYTLLVATLTELDKDQPDHK